MIIIALDSVYGAVITTQVISRVHPVNMIKVEQRRVSSVDPQSEPTDLSCE